MGLSSIAHRLLPHHGGAIDKGRDPSTPRSSVGQGSPDDFNRPARKSANNPAGCIVRTAADGSAAYNDENHEVVVSPNGSVTVLDRKTPGSDAREVNFSIHDGYVYHRNPNFVAGGNEPEYLRTAIPPEGMELVLSGGTHLFIEPHADGHFGLVVANGSGDGSAGGFIARFDDVGSGAPFTGGDNVNAALEGGNAYTAHWESSHDDGRKEGSVAKVWVTPITASAPSGAHRQGRREQRDGDADNGQVPGGFSVRSDHRYDVNRGIGRTLRFLFRDLGGEPAAASDVQGRLPAAAERHAPDRLPQDIGEHVDLTSSCNAIYNDEAHQVVATPDGHITVLDRATPGSSKLITNFFIEDGRVCYHNPDHQPGDGKPEFLSVAVPPEGMQLELSDGTHLFVELAADETVNLTITHTQGGDDSLVRIEGIGSRHQFMDGDNVNASDTGGSAFNARWSATHDDGGKQGSPAKVWVASMLAPSPSQPHGSGRRVQGGNGEWDTGQEPGGFSVRSDHRYDTRRGFGRHMDYLFYDLQGRPAHPPASTVPNADVYAQAEAGVSVRQAHDQAQAELAQAKAALASLADRYFSLNQSLSLEVLPNPALENSLAALQVEMEAMVKTVQSKQTLVERLQDQLGPPTQEEYAQAQADAAAAQEVVQQAITRYDALNRTVNESVGDDPALRNSLAASELVMKAALADLQSKTDTVSRMKARLEGTPPQA